MKDDKGRLLGRGWAGIGYHKVVRKNGDVEAGRPELYQGSHVGGLNAASVGICCSGNGDLQDFTAEQHESLAREIVGWLTSQHSTKSQAHTCGAAAS